MDELVDEGNLIYIDDINLGGVYLYEDGIVPKEKALTPTGRVQCNFEKFETANHKVLYARWTAHGHRDLIHYLDGKGWCKPAYDDGRPWIMQTVGEPESFGMVVQVYGKQGSFECSDKVYFKY